MKKKHDTFLNIVINRSRSSGNQESVISFSGYIFLSPRKIVLIAAEDDQSAVFVKTKMRELNKTVEK